MARPKSSNGDGTIQTRILSDGRTVYDVRWSYRDADRRLRRATKKGFTTRREADSFRRKVTAQVDQRTFVPPTRILLGTYLDQWLAGLRLKPQTVAGYEGDARLHITPHIGHIPLSELRPAHLTTLYRRLSAEGSPGGRGPLSPASVRNVHAVLCSALTAAVKAGLITTSPAKLADAPTEKQVKASRPPLTTWTPEQARTFLDATSADQLGALWRLLLSTGMRRGEALALRWADVDLERGQIAVQRSLGEDRRKGPDGRRRGLVFGPVKTDRPHNIAIDPQTVATLSNHHERQDRERRLLGERWIDHDLVFCRGRAWLKDGDHAGTPLNPDRVSEQFRTAVARADGVPAIRLHDLRHTWATIALTVGVPAKVVQERLAPRQHPDHHGRLQPRHPRHGRRCRRRGSSHVRIDG